MAVAGGTPYDSGAVRIFDLVSGHEIHAFDGPADVVYGLALSPDGTLLVWAASRRGVLGTTLHMRRLDTGEVTPISEAGDRAGQPFFSPDGRWIGFLAYEQQQTRQRLNRAWAQLDAVEQFVLEAMLIDEQDAQEVLEALSVLDVSLKPGVAADETSLQQLYDFKRRALARLAVLLESSAGVE